MNAVNLIENPCGISDCPGFKVAGFACDIRENKSGCLDIALISSDKPFKAAGVFTTNDVCAAPVLVCRKILSTSGNTIGGCVINSGNANACTGNQGILDAKKMSELARLHTSSDAPFLVCSTGRIGRNLPMNNIESGIRAAAKKLNDDAQSSLDAADAILTSDTGRKLATARFLHEGKEITVSGMAKGAGMIEPNMATMLAFIASDIEADTQLLNDILSRVVKDTFNRISIDGDMSTNDTVLIFANGFSGVNAGESDLIIKQFESAVFQVCELLADKIVSDGEKTTKVVKLVVKGCRDELDADKVARSIGNSLLVKSSWYGSDPNWGRIADAAGYARVGLDEKCLDLFYDDIPVLIDGLPQNDNLQKWKNVVSNTRFTITLNLNQGTGNSRLLTSDLSEAYVAFNKSE